MGITILKELPNGYGTTPQKTKEDMIKYIKDYWKGEQFYY